MRRMAYGLPPGPNTFHRQETVSEHQGIKRRDDIDPEAGRDIPHGTDEESDAERSSAERGKSAKQPTSGQRPPTDRDPAE
jgi:hypothetical protein